MTKQEFMKELEQSLFKKVSDQEYKNSIEYYSNYIDEAIRNGQREEEVIKQLDSPRLIAKAIINAKGKSKEMETIYVEDGQEEQDFSRQSGGNQWSFRINGKPLQMKWYEKLGILLIGIIVIFIVLGILGVAVSILLNVILPIAIVVFIFKMIQNFFRK